ncbi:hypothetical protein Dimus_001927, partial [Dionaea muscipula]
SGNSSAKVRNPQDARLGGGEPIGAMVGGSNGEQRRGKAPWTEATGRQSVRRHWWRQGRALDRLKVAEREMKEKMNCGCFLLKMKFLTFQRLVCFSFFTS